MALGLADRVGDLHAVLKEKYGDAVELRTIGGEKGFLRRRLGLAAAGRHGVTPSEIAEAAIGAVEERMLWEAR